MEIKSRKRNSKWRNGKWRNGKFACARRCRSMGICAAGALSTDSRSIVQIIQANKAIGANNFDIQIIQNESRKCSRKLCNMRCLGLPNDVMLSNDGRLGLTSVRHATIICQTDHYDFLARQGLGRIRWRLAYQRNSNV